MDISVQRRRWKSPPTTEELAESVASLETSIAVLDGIKAQLSAAADELGGLEARLAKTRSELERLDDLRRQILAGLG